MLTMANLGLHVGDNLKSSCRMSNVTLKQTFNNGGKESSTVIHLWSVATKTPR